MGFFESNNTEDYWKSIYAVNQAIKEGREPNQYDLERTKKAAKQVGYMGDCARKALEGRL